jgi:hypothetical protein
LFTGWVEGGSCRRKQTTHLPRSANRK